MRCDAMKYEHNDGYRRQSIDEYTHNVRNKCIYFNVTHLGN